jgi:hypothetical protein
MGAFCVFGVSKSLCKDRVGKKLPTRDPKLGRELSPAEWAARRDEQALEVFEKAEKPVKISPEFDAPQFCRDWFSVSPEEVRLARVMVRGPKVDENGNPVVRRGAQVMTWLPYEGLKLA